MTPNLSPTLLPSPTSSAQGTETLSAEFAGSTCIIYLTDETFGCVAERHLTREQIQTAIRELTTMHDQVKEFEEVLAAGKLNEYNAAQERRYLLGLSE